VAEDMEVSVDVPRRGFSKMWGKLGVNVLQGIAMDTESSGKGFRWIVQVKEKSRGETKEHAVRLFRVCIARIGKELHVRSKRVFVNTLGLELSSSQITGRRSLLKVNKPRAHTRECIAKKPLAFLHPPPWRRSRPKRRQL